MTTTPICEQKHRILNWALGTLMVFTATLVALVGLALADVGKYASEVQTAKGELAVTQTQMRLGDKAITDRLDDMKADLKEIRRRLEEKNSLVTR